MHEIFHHEIFFETEKSSSKFFMVLGHKKNPTEKGDYPPPHSYPSIFSIAEHFWITKVAVRLFSSLWVLKKSDGKTRYPPSYRKLFSIPVRFRNTRVPPTKFFGTVRKKFKKTVMLPPLLFCMISFITRIFSKQRRFPLRHFSALFDKNFPTEKRDTPFRSTNFFHTRFFLNHKDPPYEIFWSRATKKTTQPCCPPSSPNPMHEIFEFQNFSKHRSVTLQIFSALWDKKTQTEKRYPWSYPWSYPEHFWNTRVPLRKLSTLWTKNFQRKKVMTPISSINFSLTEQFGITRVPPTKVTPSPPLFFYAWNFSFSDFIETQKDSLTNFFSSVRQKKIQTEKRETFPHSHILILPTRAFLKHKGPPCWSFGTVRQKNPTKLWCHTHQHKNFHDETFIRVQNGASKFFSGTVRQKTFDGKCHTQPPIHSLFSLPVLFWNTRVLPTKFFGTVWQTKSDKTVMPPSFAWELSSR